ncbi:hypothetical protein HDU76_006397 [Blyttiomyces sp. JEL0837]|nr:hypothetical protein HDU76_006397 [Blyttiomyces sp. JEL0837]
MSANIYLRICKPTPLRFPITTDGEDPVFWGMNPRTTVFAARRRTLLVFFKPSDGPLQRWALIDNTPKVWDDLRTIIKEADPENIAIDVDPTMAFADGLHVGELENLIKNLPAKYLLRITRRPFLPISFLATRASGMLPYYQKIMQNVHEIIATAFSSDVITPGVTTTEDVQWWLRDQIQALNMTTWFHPSVDLTRPGHDGPISKSGPNAVIEKGDLLW